jgi:hypothetical protein
MKIHKEKIKQKFTRDDVVRLMRDAVSSTWGTGLDMGKVQGMFNKFLKERGFEDVLDKHSKTFYSFNEFTRGEMIEFANDVNTIFPRKITEQKLNKWISKIKPPTIL